MFRKFLLTCVASLALLSPLVAAVPAQAHESYHRSHTFHVYVCDCSREPWRCVGNYVCREDASRVARNYRAHGHDSYVR